jgi:hypothetical protein
MKTTSFMLRQLFFGLLLLQIIFVPTHYVFAEKTNMPNWVFNLYEFWSVKKISNDELIAAIKFLNEKNIITLTMQNDYDYKSNFLLSILQDEFYTYERLSCQEDWFITGYFLPIETEFHNKPIKIQVEGELREFQSDFVNHVKSEGWGRTADGDYLGWYQNTFHHNEFPLDYFGNDLIVGKIAVDPTIIKFETKIIIPTLKEPWNEIILVASDIGASIKGKHIDVYTGEGKEAEKETKRITGHNIVCFVD